MIRRNVACSVMICMDLIPYYFAPLDGRARVKMGANLPTNLSPSKTESTFGTQQFQRFFSSEQTTLRYKMIIWMSVDAVRRLERLCTERKLGLTVLWERTLSSSQGAALHLTVWIPRSEEL